MVFGVEGLAVCTKMAPLLTIIPRCPPGPSCPPRPSCPPGPNCPPGPSCPLVHGHSCIRVALLILLQSLLTEEDLATLI